ncbi:UNVERIFIED_CONTAM: hypothetical protein Slati_0803300 [Sesamum latifolium]|uniref:Uncharacterized protein n=1 Tax=Sesamum latifolium TaxID=2727402 RepID=A0AAW2XLL9_9LAMI
MGREPWVAAIGVDFALVSERLWVGKLNYSHLLTSAPPPRELRIILDFGEVKEGAD